MKGCGCSIVSFFYGVSFANCRARYKVLKTDEQARARSVRMGVASLFHSLVLVAAALFLSYSLSLIFSWHIKEMALGVVFAVISATVVLSAFFKAFQTMWYQSMLNNRGISFLSAIVFLAAVAGAVLIIMYIRFPVA